MVAQREVHPAHVHDLERVPAMIVMRAAGTAVAVLALALLAARGFAQCVEHVVPIHSQYSLLDLSRTAGAIDAAEHERVDVAFIGTSAVWFGFDPRRFDASLAARGHSLTSFNFGLVPTSVRLQRFFADAICESHRARGARWALMAYGFAPSDFLDKMVAVDTSDPS